MQFFTILQDKLRSFNIQDRTDKGSLRTADAFPVVVSLLPKNSVCKPEWQNDFRDVQPFVLMLAYKIKG